MQVNPDVHNGCAGVELYAQLYGIIVQLESDMQEVCAGKKINKVKKRNKNPKADISRLLPDEYISI